MPTGSKKATSTAVVDDPWMTVQEAARLVGMSRFRFMSLALTRGIESQSFAGRTVVSREAVEQLARELKKSA